MFGLISGMFSKSKASAPSESITIPPIMVSDYVGTANTLSEMRAVEKKIITNDLIGLFNDKVTSKHQLFLDGVIGKNNGSFPVTNPVKDNVYFYAVERKYYKCKKSVSGVINAPDTTNFAEFSLFNFKGGVSGINITGAATGSGQLNEDTGLMTVNTTVEYSKITGRPSTLPNPNGLVIKLNGTAQTTYTGSAPVELNITAASIGAQVAGNYASSSHNHDSVYSKLGHNHDDLYFTETEINNKLAGYQPKGDYASSSHKHDGVYQPIGEYAAKSHTHDYLPLAGGTVTGNLQLNGYTTVAKDKGFKFLDTAGGSHWLIHNNNGTEIGIGYGGADALPTRVYGSLYVNQDKAVWHSGNFDPTTKSDSGHNHDAVYSKLSHDHNSAYSTLGHKHDDLYQPKGSYSLTSHNHDSVYSKLSHDHAGVYQPKGDYATATHNHDTDYAVKGHDHNSIYSKLGHGHNSGEISAMTGYTKANAAAAIAVTDSLNVAIGKLEKALDGKQASGNYSVVGHNHNTEYNTKSEITTLLAGKLGKSENAVSASKLATARTIALSGAVTGSTTFDGSGNATITATLNGFDASKITSGTIHIDRLPKSALSEFLAVKDTAARLALTKTEVQNGDTVKETDTKRMFLVIDDTKLNSEAGYQEYTTVVDWSTITGRPSTFTPSAHNHKWADITDRPTHLPNAHGLAIMLNGSSQQTYTGVSDVEINITPASIGAQPAGSYAASSHNHDSVYAKVSHSHSYLPLAGGTMTGDITTKNNGGLKYLDSTGTAKWLIGNEGGNYIHIGYGSGGSNVPVYTYNEIYANGNQKVWHAGNLNPANYQPKGDYATASHNHDSVYSKLSHSHAWSTITDKPSTFTPSAHNQASNTISAMTGYTKANAAAAIAVTDSLNVAIGKLEKALDGKQAAGSYAASNHNHSGVYQPVGDYALNSHNHDKVYAAIGHDHSGVYQPVGDYAAGTHKHAWGDLTGVPGSFTPSAHNQASNTITAMTGYSKPSSTSAIVVGDTLNAAIGKLEKALDGKQNAGSYAAANHNHSGVYAPNSHTHTAGNITSMTGYTKGDTGAAIGETDTLLVAIGKLEKALDGKQASGSYSLTSHNHDGKYQPAGSYALASHNHDTQYQPKGSYATASHNHDSVYSKLNHGHVSSGITAMTGYTKASAWTAIAATDSLNVAIGKLEKALDSKQAAGSYAASNHNHNGVYQPAGNYAAASHNHDSVYAKASHGLHVPATQTANNKIFLRCDNTWHTITPAEIGAQPAGSYAAASHTHDDRYFTEAEINSKLGGYQPKGNYAAASHSHDGSYLKQFKSAINKDTIDNVSLDDGLYDVQNAELVPGYGSYWNVMNWGFYSGGKSGAKAQLAVPYQFSTPTNSELFIRVSESSTWKTPWRRVWTDGNFNPNNYQPKGSYAAASHSHSGYLPTSGGTISGALTVTGQILSNADVVAYSDKRMKTNIVKIDSALDKVSAINGYTYDMQGVEFGGQRQAGVIAQELKEVLPEAVVTDENGYYAVRYTNIIPLLIEALKEEKSKRESLEERLAKIERMLDIK